MERYFRGLSIPVDIFAVSPKDEKTWPADELVDMNGKIIGLQVKRPLLGSLEAANDFSRVHWDFSSPKEQLQRVVDHPELFYCLPTFMNRNVRDEALQHCLFWRPWDVSDHHAWYDNPHSQVKTKHAKICDVPHWGFFVEQFLACKI